jgi:hypothetical protein
MKEALQNIVDIPTKDKKWSRNKHGFLASGSAAITSAVDPKFTELLQIFDAALEPLSKLGGAAEDLVDKLFDIEAENNIGAVTGKIK